MLFILISRFARPGMRQGEAHSRAVQLNRVPGGYSEGETPGPIPNPEVKLFSADGTAREASRERRTPPNIIQKGTDPIRVGPFLCASTDAAPAALVNGCHWYPNLPLSWY